jgi:hypothetical protein
MNQVGIKILDRASGAFVFATLHQELNAAALLEAEAQWKPLREEAQARLNRLPTSDEVEHLHWDWIVKSRKLSLLAYRCMGVEYQGEWQGMMLLLLAGQQSHLTPDVGRPLVYFEMSAARAEAFLSRGVIK